MTNAWRLRLNTQVPQRMRSAARSGLLLAAEHVRDESIRIAPIEEGTLIRSATATVDGVALTAAVAYDTPYAVVQHEDLGLHHDEGRQAKYLEAAMNVEVPKVRSIIAKAIREEMR